MSAVFGAPAKAGAAAQAGTGAAAQAGSGTQIDTDHLLDLRHFVDAGEAGTGVRTMMLPGGIVTRRRGRGLETDDIRPYAFGDDVRHIDRNTTARTGQLHVRTFRDERERAVLLFADFRPSMLFGTRRAFRSVAAAEALTFAGWRVAGQGGRVGVFAATGGETFFHRPGSGDRAMKAVAGRLSAAHRAALEAPPGDDVPLSGLLEAAQRSLPHDGTLLIATALDQPGESFDAVMRDLTHRAAVDVLLIADRFELAPPAGNYPFFTQGGRRGNAEVSASPSIAQGTTSATTMGALIPSGIGAHVAERVRYIERLGARATVVDAGLDLAALALVIEGFDAARR